ncbi:uncharacterized protein MELLADRAFT_89546 [Melampsora larici-populina 98AG31]|uniref:Uncharacterized protein n=1 Tax=Melampsora larici-populina (strain 98AG31 / pathotype 3-4-7) TaxID=747676 RepID=F4RTR3_MELLP|nr:uncharacterized protein MELLADRAFT_89546 [Melampsora larici-populina 98AG31]EGG04218.1 hypothetical protein MELLADRAFT_89546 [Melampsora larici-populina 98AG31]
MDTFNPLEILRTRYTTPKYAPLKMGVLSLYVSILCSSSPIPNNSTSLGGLASLSTSGPSLLNPQGINPSAQGFSTVETNINGKKSKSTQPFNSSTPVNPQMNEEITPQPFDGLETEKSPGLPSSPSGSGSGNYNSMTGSFGDTFGNLGKLLETLLGSSSISFPGNGKPSIQSWSTVETNINGKKNVTKHHYDSNNPGGKQDGSNSPAGSLSMEPDGSYPTNYPQATNSSSNSLSGTPYTPSNSLSESSYSPSNSLSEIPYGSSNYLSGTPDSLNTHSGSPNSLSNSPSGYSPSGDGPGGSGSDKLGSDGGGPGGPAAGYAADMNSGNGGLGGSKSDYEDETENDQ